MIKILVVTLVLIFAVTGSVTAAPEGSPMFAALHAAKGDIGNAIAFLSRANAIGERNLALNLATGSERQKLAYLDTFSNESDRVISLHLRHASDDPEACKMAATMILQRKGRALDATSETLNALRGRFNPEDRALLDQLTEARSQIARLVLGGSPSMTSEQYRDRVRALEEQAERVESLISSRSAEFRAQSIPSTLEAVRAAVPRHVTPSASMRSPPPYHN